MMESVIAKLGLALAIGMLVGLERGWQERDAPEHSRTAGIRTFGISGLLGGVFAALSLAMDTPVLLAAGFLGFAGILAWYKSREATHNDDYSVTSIVAGLGVFALGALAVVGDYRAAAAGGTALAAVLASRTWLHGLLRRLTWIELRSALILAVMTAVVLPLLPDSTIDPWGGLNPWQIWFFTVLIAAISFLGYAAMRILGNARGLLLSTLAGAVVSSTAVTVALARTAKDAIHPLPLVGAASLAAMISILRVSVIVILIEPQVFGAVVVPALAAALCFGLCGGMLLLGNDDEGGDTPARNPFDLVPLLLFALFFAIVATASAAFSKFSGTGGLIATSLVSGALDADVAVLGAIRLVGEGSIRADMAGRAVLAALASNAIAKLVLAMIMAPLRFSLVLAVLTLLALLVGSGAYFIVSA